MGLFDPRTERKKESFHFAQQWMNGPICISITVNKETKKGIVWASHGYSFEEPFARSLSPHAILSRSRMNSMCNWRVNRSLRRRKRYQPMPMPSALQVRSRTVNEALPNAMRYLLFTLLVTSSCVLWEAVMAKQLILWRDTAESSCCIPPLVGNVERERGNRYGIAVYRRYKRRFFFFFVCVYFRLVIKSLPLISLARNSVQCCNMKGFLDSVWSVWSVRFHCESLLPRPDRQVNLRLVSSWRFRIQRTRQRRRISVNRL